MKNGGNYINGITGLQYGKLNITVFTKHLHDPFHPFYDRKVDVLRDVVCLETKFMQKEGSSYEYSRTSYSVFKKRGINRSS